MKTPATNPYMPAWEYVPDGEPHVFGDRIYVYGSHDDDAGEEFCLGDYAGWSAPVSDLGNWRYEGIIYRKEQDPGQQDERIPRLPGRKDLPHLIFAPDAAKGPDGRYYLYYSLDLSHTISVAVSDSPAGSFTYWGKVAWPDGSQPQDFIWFDPAVLVEESGIYLYGGNAPKKHFPGMPEKIHGAAGVRLAEDMKTIISPAVHIANGLETAKGTSFEEHPFFEAASIRHFGDWYYFVYSSLQGHELCYAMSRSPLGPFTYKGVLVSNGDVGREGNQQPQYYMGNNHGGIEKIGDKYYIFWHRHTHGGQFSRQGCADEIVMQSDGTFRQAEITSCGLNNGPLPATARCWRASIACCLQGADKEGMKNLLPKRPQHKGTASIPYVNGAKEDGQPDGYRSWVENLQPECVVGFKYFDFGSGCTSVTLTLRGNGILMLHLDRPDAPALACFAVDSPDWSEVTAPAALSGVHAVYFTVHGNEDTCVDFCTLQFDQSRTQAQE